MNDKKVEPSLKTLKVGDTREWDEMDWADYGMKVADKLENFEAKMKLLFANRPRWNNYASETDKRRILNNIFDFVQNLEKELLG